MKDSAKKLHDYWCANNMGEANALVGKVLADYTTLQKQLERYEEMAEVFWNFQKAYPTDIFPEVDDWKAVDSALAEKGLSLSRVSASNMRHVVGILSAFHSSAALEPQIKALDPKKEGS